MAHEPTDQASWLGLAEGHARGKGLSLGIVAVDEDFHRVK
jgi:hypothetical protein